MRDGADLYALNTMGYLLLWMADGESWRYDDNDMKEIIMNELECFLESLRMGSLHEYRNDGDKSRKDFLYVFKRELMEGLYLENSRFEIQMDKLLDVLNCPYEVKNTIMSAIKDCRTKNMAI